MKKKILGVVIILVAFALLCCAFVIDDKKNREHVARQPLSGVPAATATWLKSSKYALSPESTDRLLNDLVRNHSDQRVSKRLRALIEKHDVLFEVDLLDREEAPVLAVATRVRTMEDRDQLIIAVSAKMMNDPNAPRWLKEDVLLHETVHIFQHVEGRYSLLYLQDSLNRDLSKVSNEEFWRQMLAEFEAYGEECKADLKIFRAERMPYCFAYRREGEHGMRRYVARYFASKPRYALKQDLLLQIGESEERLP